MAMDAIEELYQRILTRKSASPDISYTARLFTLGEDEIVKKVGEEAIEVILAAKSQGNLRLVEEVADLTYHVLVLLALRGVSPTDVAAELARRQK
ncbi:phosphoribosyl-ATP pyrophosphatase [Longilinea arvoryzae]|uniref:Phosphoribosyl-ATP pyrophosphatase n=2 Tax=Longilinea arvoryzae TaxID=360412 RepID=A0A0S7BP11_9CHLR|nr:phosphoribosyl-ATP pyrophosphatase [Longilinea arvoryzae]